MRLHRFLVSAALALFVAGACAAEAAPTAAGTAPAAVAREHVGTRISEGIPPIPPELLERLQRYQNTRGAVFAGWLPDGAMLITTRFAETTQAHRVAMPLGMREQITFHREPLTNVQAVPPAAGVNGFAFGKDEGGSEFWQLYWYDLATREEKRLTDGKRSRNDGALWSHDGRKLAFTSTARNGTDGDIWVGDRNGDARPVLTEGGTWIATDFSPDGTKLHAMRYVSINETRPVSVDLASGEVVQLGDPARPTAYGGFYWSADGKSAYYTSDAHGEFRELYRRDLASGKDHPLSRAIPWDVQDLELSRDGRHLAFTTNEDGIGRLHVLKLPAHEEIALPQLPLGLVNLGKFSADGESLALTLNTATSANDVYVVGLRDRSLVRWTRSETGGLDPARFVAPKLVRYESFDGREIPAFYYRPSAASASRRVPVVITIHGGPESQALPVFNAMTQFLVNELGVAVLAPNVRGSAGYGKSYLLLDNGMKREDSVRDVGALLDWIAKQPELDAGRVAVQGGSYGGYMVLASLVRYSERLRAGIDVVGISSFDTYLKNTEDYRRDLRRAEYGDERDPAMREFFAKISPLSNAGRIASPLFVAQGANDPRIPRSEAEQIVQAVRARGKPVWYLLFEDEGHGFAKKANADYYGAASVLFWQQHLLPER